MIRWWEHFIDEMQTSAVTAEKASVENDTCNANEEAETTPAEIIHSS